MVLDAVIQLEARLRVLEGRELGRAAGSAKGKPKIEFYDKDRKKGMEALVTPAKVPFLSITLSIRFQLESLFKRNQFCRLIIQHRIW